MMIDNIKANENMHPNSREIELLKADFPQFFGKDGEFCLDRFKKMLRSSDIILSKEGYELNFLGKSYARYLSSTKTETFISPDIAENAKEENKNSENLYIVGNNLDALKHLLGSYAGKIKCIYIDPPYNTDSNAFVYPDNFSFDAKELAYTIGIEEEEAERIINLKGKSSHSAWLTFMYPRLILARELLSDDGVIFISIDDNEQANLKMACDEVFGEENFLSNVIWERAFAPVNLMKHFSRSHDFILCYAKNEAIAVNKGIQRSGEADNRYSNPDNDPRGVWQSDNLSVGPAVEANIYPIKTPSGRVVEPPAGRSWSLSEKVFSERLQDNRIWFGSDGNGVPRMKRFLSELRKTGITPMTIWKYADVGHSQDASKKLKDLFDDKMVFDYPKPVDLIKQAISLYTNNDDVSLDFFSGSATTAHAVMQLNAADGGNRKYILVQLPEQIKEDKPAYKAGYRTIDEIGRERIRRAAKKIKEETNADIDYGFKTYYLNELKEDVLTDLLSFDDNPKLVLDDTVGIFDTAKAKGKDAILTTYLALDGYGLSAKTEEYKLSSYTADKIEGSLYIIEQGLQSEDVMELIRRIENLELDITRVVIYTSSISFNVLHELKKNLANLRNNKRVELIERY